MTVNMIHVTCYMDSMIPDFQYKELIIGSFTFIFSKRYQKFITSNGSLKLPILDRLRVVYPWI